MANVSKLLHTTVDPETFLANLAADQGLLKEAKTKIRDCLRQAFATSSRAYLGEDVRPRFFTQGSSSYRTLNAPAWPPEQQKDLDDGCYLPLSFVRGTRPSKAAQLFFAFVDATLKTLAEVEGWTHKPKPTCVRLEVARDAHVDIPLYAIPDVQFRTLEKRAAMDARTLQAKSRPDRWEALPSDAVLLAHRKEGWIESDPRKISAWFLGAVEIYGERLRRDSRFLKAWRDHQRLEDVHLTSILLMACVWTAYEVIRGPFLPDREDERLLRVMDRLPGLLRGPMPNPACKSEDLNRMTPEERETAAKKAEELRDALREAVEACADGKVAVRLLQAAFGSRVPDRPDLVSLTMPAVASVTSHPRKVVPAPEVGRSKSG